MGNMMSELPATGGHTPKAEPAATLSHILIVDDEPPNQLILVDLLEQQFVVHTASNGRQALDFLKAKGSADLILMDIMMPEMDGFEACRQIKNKPELQDIPVLFLTGLDSVADEEHGLSLGAEDFIHKPFSPAVVLARVRNHIELARARKLLRERNAALELQVQERTRALLRETQQVIKAQESTINALCALAELRDNETGNHIRRTQNYVRTLAKRLSQHPRFAAELSEETVDLLFKSAPLHDVGKVAIPDAILLKPYKLTDAEWVVMKKHPQYGRDALLQAENELGDSVSFLRYAREIAYGHHEKWDGSGYPQGLNGAAIPLSARIMAVADVYDALISRRVYKPAMTHNQAVKIIQDGRASHFDPEIVDLLMDVVDEFRVIAARHSDELSHTGCS
jgi:putative two-component system response regulator